MQAHPPVPAPQDAGKGAPGAQQPGLFGRVPRCWTWSRASARPCTRRSRRGSPRCHPTVWALAILSGKTCWAWSRAGARPCTRRSRTGSPRCHPTVWTLAILPGGQRRAGPGVAQARAPAPEEAAGGAQGATPQSGLLRFCQERHAGPGVAQARAPAPEKAAGGAQGATPQSGLLRFCQERRAGPGVAQARAPAPIGVGGGAQGAPHRLGTCAGVFVDHSALQAALAQTVATQCRLHSTAALGMALGSPSGCSDSAFGCQGPQAALDRPRCCAGGCGQGARRRAARCGC